MVDALAKKVGLDKALVLASVFLVIRSFTMLLIFHDFHHTLRMAPTFESRNEHIGAKVQ